MTNRAPLFAAILLLVLPVLYVGSYFALLSPGPMFLEPTKGNFLVRAVKFRFGGEVSKAIFRPMIDMDMRWRPTFWCQLSERGRQWDPNAP
jgi:hypothetical protein